MKEKNKIDYQLFVQKQSYPDDLKGEGHFKRHIFFITNKKFILS